MNYEKEIRQNISDKVFNLLADQVQNGFISEHQMQKIGLEMHPRVNGVFVHQGGKFGIRQIDIWELMLDCWYEHVLYSETVDGQQRLKDIFTKVDLLHLAHKIDSYHDGLENGDGSKENQTSGTDFALQTGQPEPSYNSSSHHNIANKDGNNNTYTSVDCCQHFCNIR